jgi:phenylalanyl-tRNA synthetase beta chain
VIRDISFVADRGVSFAAIRDAVISQNAELIRNIEFVDVYEGKEFSENERSLTVRLEYRSDERTLVENEVDEVHRGIVDSIVDVLGIRIRA